MPRDRRLRDPKATGHHADPGWPAGQPLNDPAADRMSNRMERFVSHSANNTAQPKRSGEQPKQSWARPHTHVGEDEALSFVTAAPRGGCEECIPADQRFTVIRTGRAILHWDARPPGQDSVPIPPPSAGRPWCLRKTPAGRADLRRASNDPGQYDDLAREWRNWQKRRF